MHDQETFNWIVAIDEEGHCRSSMEFAKWMRARSDRHRFFAIHASNPAEDGPVIDGSDRAAAVIRSAQAEYLFDDHIDATGSPADVLGRIPRALASGLIVSRHARARGSEIIRLGGIVRGLIDDTDLPLIVVPRDYNFTAMGTGPVLAAVDPEDSPAEFGHLSLSLAQSLLRPLMLAHVETQGHSPAAEGMQSAADALRTWSQEAKLGDVGTLAGLGEFRFRMMELARRSAACMMTCHTDQRSWPSRLLSPSRALELARYATCPVALFPGVEAQGEAALSA